MTQPMMIIQVKISLYGRRCSADDNDEVSKSSPLNNLFN